MKPSGSICSGAGIRQSNVARAGRSTRSERFGAALWHWRRQAIESAGQKQRPCRLPPCATAPCGPKSSLGGLPQVHNQRTIAIGTRGPVAGLGESSLDGPPRPSMVGTLSHRRSPKLDKGRRDISPRVPLGIRNYRAEIRSDCRPGTRIGDDSGGDDVPLFPKPPRRMTGTGPVVGQRTPPHSPHYGRSPIPIITVQQRKRCLRDGSARFRSKLGTGIRDASLRAFWPSGRVQDAARVPAQQGEKSCKKYLLQRSNFCYIDCVLTSRACATTANACTS